MQDTKTAVISSQVGARLRLIGRRLLKERPAYLSQSGAEAIDRGLRLTAKLIQSPRSFLRDAWGRRRDETAVSNNFTPLSPDEALAENGFAVIHGLLGADECARLAAELRQQHLAPHMREYTSIDAVNRSATARELLFDRRIIGAVERTIQTSAKFLQVSDIQIDHDHTVWHRDGAYRDPGGLDFADRSAPYRAVKIILYLESDDAGLAMIPGSHQVATDVHDRESARLDEVPMTALLRAGIPANRRLTARERAGAVVWCAGVGDALLFDERLFHRGRRVKGTSLTSARNGRKLTVAYVFGADNVHSSRLHSYFRYARPDLRFATMSNELLSRLAAAGIALKRGYGNHFLHAQDELWSTWQRPGTDLDALVALHQS